MHRILYTLVLTIISATTASAGAPRHPKLPKQVEVINLPEVQAVEVINPTSPAILPRFQLVGFTSAVYDGKLGGFFGAALKCQQEFPESRLCHISEAVETTEIPTGLSGLAWVEFSTDGQGSCRGWNSNLATSRTVRVLANDGSSVNSETLTRMAHCGQSLYLACCALVP